MSIILGLDIGKKRTGIAKSDSMGIIIKPLKTVLTEKLIDEIHELKADNEIEKFIIGEPVNIQEGNKDAHNCVMQNKAKLEENFKDTEIILIDERFTSKEAQSALKEQGKKITKDNKELIDMYAAGIILEQYFNSLEE